MIMTLVTARPVPSPEDDKPPPLVLAEEDQSQNQSQIQAVDGGGGGAELRQAPSSPPTKEEVEALIKKAFEDSKNIRDIVDKETLKFLHKFSLKETFRQVTGHS